MERCAEFDKKREYRFVLKRKWGTNADNFVNFILLNPSTADENTDDPTIRRCINFAQSWRYDGIWVTNLFAYKATEPENMKKADDPVGEKNDSYIEKYAEKSKKIVVAWGDDGDFRNRRNQVIRILSQLEKDLYCFHINKSGNPQHALRVSNETLSNETENNETKLIDFLNNTK